MENEKDFDSRIWSKENMVMILVRKRSAAMRGVCKFLRKPGCQFDTWLTSVLRSAKLKSESTIFR